MNIYGLDFTSSPDRTKLLTLAHCKLDETKLIVEKLECLNTEKDSDFSKVKNWLDSNFEGIAGVDFPFGLPMAAIQHFKWTPVLTKNWAAVLDLIYDSCKTLTEFQDKVEGWKRLNKENNLVKVHIKRLTDQIAGSTVSSPLKVRDYPPIGSMFYIGARLLKEAGLCVYPVQINNNRKIVVEAYPALVANRFIGPSKYKGQIRERKASARCNRADILRQLSEENVYGIKLFFPKEQDRVDCIIDDEGDKLDSILCATQAAWASKNNFGIPRFAFASLTDSVAIEGWIADPATYSHF